MSHAWLTTFKQSNQRKTIFLMILFPLFLFGICLLLTTFFATENYYNMTHRFNEGLIISIQIFAFLLPIIVIRGIVTFFFQRQIMFKFSWAKELTRTENPEIYNIVENLCISKGLPIPKIWIIPTPGLNAFATGRRTKDSRIVFTQGLVNTLDKREIEAVAAHELSHIINKDSMLMLVTVVFIGIISIIGEILLRIRIGGNSKDNKAQLITILAGIAFLLLGYLVYPLLKLAISRKREFLADAGAVELTKDNHAMISALRKISGNSSVPTARKNVAMFFIESPTSTSSRHSDPEERTKWATKEKNLEPKKSSIRDTHPSIDERISVLQGF